MEKRSGVSATKFVLSAMGLLCLIIPALAGKFGGDYAFSVVSIVVTYVTGNAFITGKALSNGKHPNGAEK